MVGEGAAVLVRRALAYAGLADVPAALPRFRQIYDSRLLRHTRPYPGIPEALHRAREYARLAVLTNKPIGPSERILEALDLRPLFDSVIGGDGPFPRKPEPASLRALMEEASAVPSATLLVGDSLIDHETAQRAEVRCCLVSYGFGYSTFPPERLTSAEWIVSSASELPKVFHQFMAG
jgi:phosphoglycolate phosphatase